MRLHTFLLFSDSLLKRKIIEICADIHLNSAFSHCARDVEEECGTFENLEAMKTRSSLTQEAHAFVKTRCSSHAFAVRVMQLTSEIKIRQGEADLFVQRISTTRRLKAETSVLFVLSSSL